MRLLLVGQIKLVAMLLDVSNIVLLLGVNRWINVLSNVPLASYFCCEKPCCLCHFITKQCIMYDYAMNTINLLVMNLFSAIVYLPLHDGMGCIVVCSLWKQIFAITMIQNNRELRNIW